jgi:hypothetical protein
VYRDDRTVDFVAWPNAGLKYLREAEVLQVGKVGARRSGQK